MIRGGILTEQSVSIFANWVMARGRAAGGSEDLARVISKGEQHENSAKSAPKGREYVLN